MWHVGAVRLAQNDSGVIINPTNKEVKSYVMFNIVEGMMCFIWLLSAAGKQS